MFCFSPELLRLHLLRMSCSRAELVHLHLPLKLCSRAELVHLYVLPGVLLQGLAVGQTYNIGRPETVESLFYLWRATKDPIYREWGWQIWLAFEKHCKVDSGYTGLRNVRPRLPRPTLLGPLNPG